MRLHSCRAPDQTQTVSLLPYHWRLPWCCRVHQHQTKSCTGNFQDTDVDKNDLIYLSLSSSSSQHDHPAGSPCPLSVSSLSLQDPSGSQALTGSSPSFFFFIFLVSSSISSSQQGEKYLNQDPAPAEKHQDREKREMDRMSWQ